MSIFIMKLICSMSLFIGLLVILKVPILKKGRKNSLSFTKAAAKAKRVKINADVSLRRYEKFLLKVDALLRKINKTRKYLYLTMAACFFSGCLVGYLCFQGALLAFITGLAFVPITYLYLLLRTQAATREELADLENMMSMITNAYLSSGNILKAVEICIEEKNRYTDERFRKVTPFEEFVTSCVYINPNVELGLEQLAAKINNKYFDLWVKNLRLCIGNRNMRFSLRPVIDSMADEKIMQIESDTQMAKTWGTYFLVVGLMFGSILVFRIARRSWYLILVDTLIGKAIIVMMLIAALISAMYVMKINKPIGTV